MKNVLLVTSPMTDAPNAVGYALGRAREMGGGLIGLAILDPEQAKQVAATLTTTGFLGEKVSDSVIETLQREQRAQAEMLLERIGGQAAQAGISYTPLIEEGDPSEVCGRIVRVHQVESVVLVAEKRSWLSRFLSRAPGLRTPALGACEVKIMDD